MAKNIGSQFAIGQYLNTQGLKSFFNALLFNRSHFTPHLRSKSVASINYKALHSSGIKYIVFDKDNTLTAPYKREYFSAKIRYAVLDECAEAFGIHHVAIISNSAGSKDDKDGIEAH